MKHKFLEWDKINNRAGVPTYNPLIGTTEYQPRLDILINCAGVVFAGDLDNIFPQDHDYMMDVNARAPFVLLNFF